MTPYDEVVLARQRARVLLLVINELPDEDRFLIKLRFGFGVSQSDAALIFGITQQAISLRERAALERARAVFERIGITRMADVM